MGHFEVLEGQEEVSGLYNEELEGCKEVLVGHIEGLEGHDEALEVHKEVLG